MVCMVFCVYGVNVGKSCVYGVNVGKSHGVNVGKTCVYGVNVGKSFGEKPPNRDFLENRNCRGAVLGEAI